MVPQDEQFSIVIRCGNPRTLEGFWKGAEVPVIQWHGRVKRDVGASRSAQDKQSQSGKQDSRRGHGRQE